MQANSRPVTSNQIEWHPRLHDVVTRHCAHAWRKPIAAHTQRAFDQWFKGFESNRPLVLDSGCGTGESSARIGALYPESHVLGIDQSIARLQSRGLDGFGLAREGHITWMRTEAADVWRLLQMAGVRVMKHYLLYPNPWPKAEHLMRRWHGHPVFPVLLSISDAIELRSNWKTYLDEFSEAVTIVQQAMGDGLGVASRSDLFRWQMGVIEPIALSDSAAAITPFEQKYARSGHGLWRLQLARVTSS